MNKYILVATCLLIISCQKTDSLYREQLIGTWKQEYKLNNNTVVIEEYAFLSDGKFAVKVRKRSNGPEIYETLGTWKVKDGYIFYTVSTSENPRIKSGSKDQNRIISIDGKEAITEGKSGRVLKARRIR